MSTSATTLSAADTASLPLMLSELRLPTIKRLRADIAEQANHEDWPAQRYLSVLLEQEMIERETRRQRNFFSVNPRKAI